MGNSNASSAVRDLADKLASANGKRVTVVTPDMRKQMGNMLVVMSRNCSKLVLNGGANIGVKNGTEISSEEFNKKLQQPGARCVYNPRLMPDGSLDLGLR